MNYAVDRNCGVDRNDGVDKNCSVDRICGGSYPTLQTLKQDDELKHLVDNLNQTGLSDLLNFQECAKSKSTTGKFPHLSIKDFVKRELYNDVNEEVIFTGNEGSQLALKSNKRKITTREVSVHQWVGANQRIFVKLSPLFSGKEAMEYNEYVCQISDLFAKYNVKNVMEVDEMHRKEVAETGRAWNSINVHLFHLLWEATPNVSHQNQNFRKNKKFSDLDSRGNKICLQFNTPAGCRFKGNCKFRHVCSIPGCFQASHPSYLHQNQSNNQPFRGNEVAPNAKV